MEKYSKWRDPATGIAPFLVPLPSSTDSLPPALKVVFTPFVWLFAGTRTALVCLVLIGQFLLVDVLLSVCLVVPPVHAVLSRLFNAAMSRLVLVLLGFVWINAETASLRRTGRSPPVVPFAPAQGDVIIANSSSYVDLLYLAFRYNPTFLLPVSSTGSKASASSSAQITSWRRVSLFRAIIASGDLPERSERGESLEQAIKKARGPVVIFPECTTSNNRAILRFGELLPSSPGLKSTPLKTYVLSFKYPLPARLTPSATYPIRSPRFSPIAHIFALTSSPVPLSLTIRRLHASESPKFSTLPKKEDWDAISEGLTTVGRWKKVGGLDWEKKQAFLEFRKKR